MTIKDLLNESFKAIRANKIKSGLTVLGIVIGISSVIALISIGKGAQGSIEASIQSIGSNLVMVMPGFQRNGSVARSGRGSATTLTQEDAEAIKKEISLAKEVAPEISRNYQIAFKGKNTNTRVIGTVSEYADVRNVTIDTGTFITKQQEQSKAHIAVLGPTVSADLFGQGVDPIGQKIKIGKIDFSVVGMTTSKGGSGFNNQDDMIFVPITTAQSFLSGDNYVSTISITATDKGGMSDLQNAISELLLKRHGISNPQLADFSVLNQADIVQAASSVTNTFTVLLASIAGISLVVGGIGIMNMMLTAVTERTREIGLRKAIGARRQDINRQFLFEAVIITAIGGFIGIILGWLISLVVAKFASIPTTVSLSAIFLASGISIIIGVVFGYYPARRAAILNPIDALRYE